MIKKKMFASLSMALMLFGSLGSLQAADSAGVSGTVTTLPEEVSTHKNDFDQDGVQDLVWRNSDTGEYLFFFMNPDGTRKGYKYGYQIDTAWKIVGIADQDNDGVPDLLWRNPNSGEYIYFFMNPDGTRKGYKYGYPISNTWSIVNK